MLPVYTVHNSASPIAIEISINIASCVYEMFCKGILSSRALLYYLCSDIECTRQGKVFAGAVYRPGASSIFQDEG